MVKYANNHSITETANRYRCSRKCVHKWVKRWDGTLDSLKDRSRRPKRLRTIHSQQMISKIIRRLKQCKWRDIIYAFQLSKERDGYTGSYGSFKALARRLKENKPKKKKKTKPKPYMRAEYVGQKVQIDVKYVPKECVSNGRRYYQFTAVDECSRWTYRAMYEEKSTYSAKDFLIKLIKNAPFPIKRVQTDNGSEFTNALMIVKSKHKSLFEKALEVLGIEYQRIRIATPRHNGKVERQHRIDGERFYSSMRMYSLEDGRKQLARYQKESNKIIKTCLDMKSPNQVVQEYLSVMF
jgi:transposase